MVKGLAYFVFSFFCLQAVAQNLISKDPSACKGLNEDVYLTWINEQALYFSHSADGGKSWPTEAKLINPVKNGVDYEVDGVRYKGKPVIACDTSPGNFRNRIYICWSEEKHGAKNKDVFLVYSDDKGLNWTEPILVTFRPNHKEQFKPTMCINQKTGRLSIVYFDKQNYLGTGLCDTYLALSDNGGLKFDSYKLNELPVKIDTKNPMINAVFYDTAGRNLINWTNLDDKNKLLTIQTVVTDSLLNSFNHVNAATEAKVEKTFRYADKIKIGIGFNDAMLLSATITKPLEPGFEKVVIRNQKCVKGLTTVTLDTKQLGLAKGNYILTLYYGNKNSFVWITE